MDDSGHIFISYKTEERELAFEVRDRLQEWGYEVWLDVDRLKAGTYWANHINQALKTCHACIGIMTPLSIGSRYVTNEWDVAMVNGKTFLPLMFEPTEPHYKYIDIQYIDFTSKHRDAAYSKLRLRLEELSTLVLQKTPDPYTEYLQALYDRINTYLSAKLIKSLRDEQNYPEPIQLAVERTDEAVDVLFHRRKELDPLFMVGGLTKYSTGEFDDFSKAFEFFDGRVLLLGDPGSGKTVTLLHFARDAIVKRRNNSNAPLPILAIIPTWDSVETFEKWISSAYGVPENTLELIQSGEALLLLDGLDELGSEKEIREGDKIVETFDPRERFIQQLPANNQLLLTSRTKEFADVGTKIALNGAITLRQLNSVQIARYLEAQPELLDFVKSEDSIQEWLDTPLLLSFFALAYEGMTSFERNRLVDMLHNASELRSTIFDGYIRERYKHEENKYKLRGEHMNISMEDMLAILSRVALRNMVSFDRYDTTSHGTYLQPLVLQQHSAYRPNDIIQNEWGFHSETFDKKGNDRVRTMIQFSEMPAVILACQLNLMLEDGEQYEFIHLLMRNHLAYKRCVDILNRPIDENLSTVHWGYDVVAAAIALRDIKDLRAEPYLMRHIDNDKWFEFGYRESANPSVEAKLTLKNLSGYR